MNGELELLLRLHDGDDRCGCLRSIIDLWIHGTHLNLPVDDLTGDTIIRLSTCLEHHPAGSVYRSLHRPVE